MISNIKNNSENSFGFSENRIVFDAPAGQPEAPKVQTRIKDITTDLPSPAEREKAVKDSEKRLTDNQALIHPKIDAYNKKYGELPWVAKIFTKTNVDISVTPDYNNPQATIDRINAILNAKIEKDGIKYRLSDVPGSTEQIKLLNEIKKMFEGRLNLMTGYKSAERAYGEIHEGALLAKGHRVEEMTELMSAFDQNPNYKKLESDYNAVFGRMILKDPEFKRFYERADRQGEVNPQRERENKQLFFSILAKETGNFKTTSLFPKMTDDAEQNKKEYPFIYNEWIKTHGFDASQIEIAKNDLEKKSKEAGMANPDELEGQIILKLASINKNITKKRLSSDYTFKNPLDDLVTPKNEVYYHSLGKNLKVLDTSLELSIRELNKDPDKKEIANFLEQFRKNDLPLYIEIAEAHRQYQFHFEKQTGLNSKFTKTELDRDENRQTVMELAMKQYAKAMDVVDNPFHGINDKKNKDDVNWQDHLHPGVRRMMIAVIYKEGVAKSADAKKTTNNEVRDQYKWMLGNLAQSKYFNNESKDKYLDPEQREFLVAARLANAVAYKITLMEKNIIPRIQGLTDSLKKDFAEKSKASSDDEKKAIQDSINKKIAELDTLTTINPVNEGNALTILTKEQERMKNWREFVKTAEGLMKNPDRVQIRAFLTDVSTKTTINGLDDTQNNIQFNKEYADYLKDVDLTYNTLDLKERGTGQYLERMGIHVEGVYQAYLNYFKTHPDIKIDQWEFLMRTKEGTDKLTAMFNVILPDSNVFKGRENFLAVFSTLNGKNVGQNPEMRDGQAVAMNIFHLLKMEMTHREQVSAATLAGNEKALQKLNGMTFGDKITDTFKGVKDMILGPGQSISNRVAGAVLLILAFKAAKSAYKGDSPMGKLLRAAFVGGSIELALKHMYGEGLTDKLRLSGLADALGGTYESVLLDRGKHKEINITETEHAAALMELRNAPFDKVMDWYKATKSDGSPMPGKERVKIPSPIDIYNIVPGRMDEGKERKARVILKKTIENFFGYVANKDEKSDPADGQGILEEVWVKAIKDQKYQLDDSRFARRNLPTELIKNLRESPRALTWQMVMQAEIKPEDVTKVTKKGVLESAKDIFTENAAGIEKWSRRDIEHPASVKIEKAFKAIDTYYTPKIKELIIAFGENRATDLHVAERYIELKYENKKYEIKRFAGDVFTIVSETIKLPLSVLYGTTEWVVPTAAQKITQLREIIADHKYHEIDKDHKLGSEDIMKTDILAQYKEGLADPNKAFDLMNTDKNHEARYFGYYQIPFRKAMVSKMNGNIGFYQSKKEFVREDGLADIGYLVTETSTKEPGININNSDSLENKYMAMQIKAHAQAVEFYKEKGLSVPLIEKYMYPIHIITQKGGPDGNPPQKIYTFWRMPMPGSTELFLKENDRWADYYDPNKIKERPPFIVDNKLGILDNLKLAFGVQSPALRKAGDYTTLAVSQWIRAIFFVPKVADKIIGDPVRFFMKDKSQMNWLGELAHRDEKTLQRVDEWLGSAENTSTALSEFYSNSHNSEMYKRALEYARKHPEENGGDINLEKAPQDGKDQKWEWQKVNVDTGKYEQKGNPIYRDGKGGTGRLNIDTYQDKLSKEAGETLKPKEKNAKVPSRSKKAPKRKGQANNKERK